jgi:hypothetical protein
LGLNSQVAALKSQISDLQEKYTANLVTALGANEISSSIALFFVISTYLAQLPMLVNSSYVSQG